MVKILLGVLGRLIVFTVLTILTQTGGIVYLFSLSIIWLLRHRLDYFMARQFVLVGVFALSYLVSVALLVPPIAKHYGREALPWLGDLKPLTLMTCLLNRHYVRPSLKQLAVESSEVMGKKYPASQVHYLDASFPFHDGFPLGPHRSHNDGKKLDIAFFYTDKEGAPSDHTPSFIGYGVYEAPRVGEENVPERCEQKGFWQYSFLGKLGIPNRKTDYIFDEARTGWFLSWMCRQKTVEKIFIEPHLKSRLQLTSAKIRYHGCQAVRHDDHIHLQVW